ncbi:hypothetical protein RBG61_09705 [Paludicola sp. MB14-C6]|uniref:hypothetical protein n=1 Tax=Paludihabitans sp. MB14-C6 TaxID=3070656 RepID=UPI0027DB0294|nr:hypothetical protein [Paludicola sp. MB14-C6]WMJ22262.1 hypothetical protein RBG61_09705 [Paludicola sp. MB14-C6]
MKYVKNLGVILLSIALLLSTTACQKQKVVPSNAQKYQYNYYPATDWGMTRENCLKALHLKETDVTDGVLPEIKEKDIAGFSIKKQVFGYPATIYFCFYSKKVSQTKEMGLADIYVVYEGQFDAVKITNELVKGLEKQKIPFVNYNPELKDASSAIFREYSSKETLQSLNDVALKEKAKKAFSLAYNGADVSKYESKPLSLVNIKYPIEGKCSIYFAGYVPAILNNIE